jgi:hypothetical protein
MKRCAAQERQSRIPAFEATAAGFPRIDFGIFTMLHQFCRADKRAQRDRSPKFRDGRTKASSGRFCRRQERSLRRTKGGRGDGARAAKVLLQGAGVVVES